MRAEPQSSAATEGPWSRFAARFDARPRARWAWRACLILIGLAVCAPLIATDLPLRVWSHDAAGVARRAALIEPLAARVASLAKSPPTTASDAEFARARAALAEQSRRVARDLDYARESKVAAALAELDARTAALATGADAPSAAQPLLDAARAVPREVDAALRAQSPPRETRFPAFAALSAPDLAAIVAWLALMGIGWRTRGVAARDPWRRLAWGLVLAALGGGALGVAHRLERGGEPTLDWSERVAADPGARVWSAPVAHSPYATELSATRTAPGAAHWLGSDALGRDLLARLLHAGRTSFRVALLAAALILAIGTSLGLLAGALGGAVDTLVARAIELLQAFPVLVLLLGVLAVLPNAALESAWTLPLWIGAIGWPHVARLTRAEAQRVARTGYVRAAHAAGLPPLRVLALHHFPNSLSPMWIAASFVVSAGLVLESSAAFLGLGVRPPTASFGALIGEARGGEVWWLALFPGLWLFAAILSVHWVGEGVREALDVRDEGASLP